MNVGKGARLGVAKFIALAVCALVAFACLNVGVARATDTQTRSIGGLNYTLPADWEQLASADDLADLDQFKELGIDLDSVRDLAVWAKGDGVFAALAISTAAAELPSLSELEATATYAQLSLAGSPFEGIQIVAATDQDCPALVAYSDDITFNSETYAVTAELFSVNNASFTGIVAMMSFLPTSGVVNEDAMSLVEELAQDATVSVGDFTYTVPAGSYLARGNVFAMEYAYGFDPSSVDGGLMFALNVPVDLGISFSTGDLQLLATELGASLPDLLSESLAQTGLGVSVDDLWTGAYTWLGVPTIGLELTLEDSSSVYVGIELSVADDALTLLFVAEPSDSPYAANLLNSAESSISTSASAGSFVVGAAASATDASASDADEAASVAPGFVVGFTAADGAR